MGICLGKENDKNAAGFAAKKQGTDNDGEIFHTYLCLM